MINALGRATPEELIGRGDQVETVNALLGDLSDGAAGLIVRGEAGIGKSALLAHAGKIADERGLLTLSTVGVESEAHLAFAGLHQLVRPILDRTGALPGPQRASLEAAFGLTEGSGPDQFRVALGAFHLVCECADSTPILLLLDDAQWIDSSTMDVLSFIARRLESEPVRLLVAMRDDFAISLQDARLPELLLERLGQEASEELLDIRAPDLSVGMRTRVLDTAEGNPLGLMELGAVATSQTIRSDGIGGAGLPLTDRLVQSFASRLEELPEPTRVALLAAALDERASLGEIAAAARLHSDCVVTVEAVDSAAVQRLAFLEDTRIRFRHPLIRSAAEQSASPAQRRAMHEALATVVEDGDRQLWHRAAAAVGVDEALAHALESYGERASARGAATTAARAFERAAALSEETAGKGRRLVRAAALAYQLGSEDLLRQFLVQIEPAGLGALDQAHSEWLRQISDGTVWSRSGAVRKCVAIADRISEAGDNDLALSSLIPVALRCWWTRPTAETRQYLVTSARRMRFAENDPRTLAVTALAHPEAEAGTVLRNARALGPDEIEDPAHTMEVGLAAGAVGEWGLAAEFLAPAVDSLRQQGRLGVLTQALLYQAWAGTCTGDWRLADASSAEAARLASDTHQPQYGITAQFIGAIVAAIRGTGEDLDQILLGPERALVNMRGGPMLAPARLARAEAALGEGRHDDAFEHIWPVFDPADPAFHPFIRWWTLLEFVEAAARSGHVAEAHEVIGEIEKIAARCDAPVLDLSLACARPLLASDVDANELFDAALSRDLKCWPFMRARTLLSYGEWLRRRRRVADSRRPLRGARELFDALGAKAWGERARQELRATGHTVPRRGPDTRDDLTAQELQIAELAAKGLSNRDIGERLFLSHRTIGSHLYRIFPKLGITSRAQLSTALATATDDSEAHDPELR
jgi:ATP/maltotriose-dependent transcriptional regulator MalT